jgi:hypothetical protein
VTAVRTKLTIMGIVLAIVIGVIAVTTASIAWLGPWVGLATVAGGAAMVLLIYHFVIGPRWRNWGATEEDLRRLMPGDTSFMDTPSTTRAITIRARPDDVWPWLVQIGYGRGGWYSYDWIDNDGKPSARGIDPALQDLDVGDRIEMVPGMGPVVMEIEPNEYLLCGGPDDRWCLALYPTADGATRLVSRWHQAWKRSIATAFWTLLSDPGSFVMERKMLLNLKDRAETLARVRKRHPSRAGR